MKTSTSPKEPANVVTLSKVAISTRYTTQHVVKRSAYDGSFEEINVRPDQFMHQMQTLILAKRKPTKTWWHVGLAIAVYTAALITFRLLA